MRRSPSYVRGRARERTRLYATTCAYLPGGRRSAQWEEAVVKKAVEPPMTAEERQQLARVLEHLRIAADLERKAMAESDRLMKVAWELGATDATIGAAMGVTLDTARMRRRRRKLRPEHRQRMRRAA